MTLEDICDAISSITALLIILEKAVPWIKRLWRKWRDRPLRYQNDCKLMVAIRVESHRYIPKSIRHWMVQDRLRRWKLHHEKDVRDYLLKL